MVITLEEFEEDALKYLKLSKKEEIKVINNDLNVFILHPLETNIDEKFELKKYAYKIKQELINELSLKSKR